MENCIKTVICALFVVSCIAFSGCSKKKNIQQETSYNAMRCSSVTIDTYGDGKMSCSVKSYSEPIEYEDFWQYDSGDLSSYGYC